MRKFTCFIIATLLMCVMLIQLNENPQNLNSPQPYQKPSSVTLSSDPPETNLTWTSRTQYVSQLFGDNSVIIGDHIVLNATFTQTPYVVVKCELYIWNPQYGTNATVTTWGSRISFDTYYLDRINQAYNIRVTGTTVKNDYVVLSRDNVSIYNFYHPVVTVNNPIEIDDYLFNLTWSCSDLNRDDVNYFEVWLSNDGGSVFHLLVRNITQTWFIWDSSYWLEGDYIIGIHAQSVDLTSAECRLDDPPRSYWPGDSSTGYSVQFQHTGIPRPLLSISTIDDITYEYGSTGNSVKIALRFSYNHPASINCVVRDNGTYWFERSISVESIQVIIELDISGLSIGSHNIDVEFLFGDNASLNFVIDVIESSLGPFISLSLSIGIMGGITIIVMFIIYMKIRQSRT